MLSLSSTRVARSHLQVPTGLPALTVRGQISELDMKEEHERALPHSSAPATTFREGVFSQLVFEDL